MKLDKQTLKKLRIFKKAARAQRKLDTKPFASRQQRDSWKRIAAKGYREFPTKAEKSVTEKLKALGFQPQFLVRGYIADFAHVGKRVIVEIDGLSHEGREAYDANRDATLSADGWLVLRFSNEVALRSPSTIYEACK